METIVLEVPIDFAQQFNELSVAKKKYYADAFKRLFFNENRIEKERLNGDVAIPILLAPQ